MRFQFELRESSVRRWPKKDPNFETQWCTYRLVRAIRQETVTKILFDILIGDQRRAYHSITKMFRKLW